MKNAPQVFSADSLTRDWPVTAFHDDFARTQERALARPPAPRDARGLRARARLAWRVFSGKADALVWRGQ
ncbi:hypothetical protein G3A43_08425 [Paraburkholderia aspalathi]|nr:hypothetical protein [Paraburkholderia aspalathi]MBK3780282.1 hypothetical protein [Paraburkholderia aspalathi]